MDIIIKNLCKSYGNSAVLKNINIAFPIGKTTCLMGKSGAGKTTLLNILMGLEKTDIGTIENMPEYKSAVFQENRLCENFSVLTNIKIVNNSLSQAEIQNHLKQVGLEDSANRKIYELSGGMKRRIALVRAVMAKSDIIFLDEPFKGLDVQTKQLVIKYLLNNINNKTVILVTHNSDDAKQLNGNILYLENNKITN